MTVSLDGARRGGSMYAGTGSNPVRERHSRSLTQGQPGALGSGNCAPTLCAFWRIDTGRLEMRWTAGASPSSRGRQ